MSDNDGASIVQEYRDSFVPRKQGDHPTVILTVSVICAETNERAEEMALSSLIWSLLKEKGERNHGVPSIEEAKAYVLDQTDKKTLDKIKQNMIIGNPHVVKQKLNELQRLYHVDEIMIVTITHSPKDRVMSYQLIADEM